MAYKVWNKQSTPLTLTAQDGDTIQIPGNATQIVDNKYVTFQPPSPNQAQATLVDGSMAAPLPSTITALAQLTSDVVLDNLGGLFSPASGSHVYAYDGSGQIVTDTATFEGLTRVKTYTWTSGQL